MQATTKRSNVPIDDWLTLGLAAGMRGSVAAKLLAEFDTPGNVVSAGGARLQAAGLKAQTIRDIGTPDAGVRSLCRDWLARDGHALITWDDPAYPPLLKTIHDAPTLLFLRGNVDALYLPQLAIIGSRNATPGGCDTARRFAAHLGGAGFCITSGLAIGIDAAAHQGALEVNARTIAVCATGPDETYPRRHAGLADAVAANGAVVTEFPPGSPPQRHRFPQRNRVISGLSVGTLVVEAGLRSGALITARFAAEQGREVFAIPGSIHNPTARGCHQLIRSGAKLVESSDDIIEELTGMLAGVGELIKPKCSPPECGPAAGRDPEYQRLLELMGWDPVTVNTLVARGGLTAEEVSSMLLILELEGHVEPLAGGAYIQREEGPTR